MNPQMSDNTPPAPILTMEQDGTYTAMVYGTIDSCDYEGGFNCTRFAKELAQLPQNATVKLRIYSFGGNAFDGLSAYQSIKRATERGATITAYIDVVAASAATVLALGAQRVVMAETAMFMIHNSWGGVVGNSQEMRRQAEMLDKITAQYVAIYATKTGLPEAKIKAMMDKDEYMTAKQALALGFADEIGEAMVTPAYMQTLLMHKPQRGTKPPAAAPATQPAQAQNDNDLSPITEPPKMELAQMALSVGLPATATAEQVQARIAELNAAETALKAQAAANRQAAETRVHQALADKLIEASAKNALIELGAADPAALDGILKPKAAAAPPLHTLAGNQDKGAGSAIIAARADWTLKDWLKKDPSGLTKMRKDHPDLYAELARAFEDDFARRVNLQTMSKAGMNPAK